LRIGLRGLEIIRKTSILAIFMLLVVVALVSSQPAAASSDWVNETIGVDALGWSYYHGTWTEGETADVTINVTSSGDITFAIMNQNNYYTWANGSTASAYVVKNDVVDTHVTWEAPGTATYYFVFDNTDSLLSVQVSIKIVRYEPGELFGDALIMAILGVIGIVAVVATIVVVYLMRARRKPSSVASTRLPAQPSAEPSSRQISAQFCAFCGARITARDAFCPNCGSPIARKA
jgi:hypothetical protein